LLSESPVMVSFWFVAFMFSIFLIVSLAPLTKASFVPFKVRDIDWLNDE